MSRNRAAEFVQEARRRRVFRVAGLYIVGSWVLLQIADLAFPALKIPELAIRYVWIAALLGFPIALLFGWRYDLLNGRVVRTVSSSARSDISLQTIDYGILLALACVGILIVIGSIGGISDTQYEYDDWPSELSSSSIAVLPFAKINVSPENAFLARGLAEELLNALSKIKKLQVIARSSSFRFSGDDMDVRSIGSQLGVATIVEGSVSVVADKVRVSVQLVDTRTGTNRWSGSYDRAFGDILAMQTQISGDVANAIASNLGIELDSDDLATITRPSPEAFVNYLRGRELIRETDVADKGNLDQALFFFQEAISLHPDFADAFVGLVDAYLARAFWYFHKYELEKVRVDKQNAKKAARHALTLDPQSSSALRAAGMTSDDPAIRIETFRQAVLIDPNNAPALRELAADLLNAGDFAEGVRLIRRFHHLDPFDFDGIRYLAAAALNEGKLKEAVQYFRKGIRQGGFRTNQTAPVSYAGQLPEAPTNLGFENGMRPWEIDMNCSANFEFSIVEVPFTGEFSGQVDPIAVDESEWCAVYQAIAPEKFRSKFIRLKGVVKNERAYSHGKLWLRVNSEIGVLGFDDGMWRSHPTSDKDNEWRTFELRLFVPEDATYIVFGTTFDGSGKVWFDDFQVETSNTATFSN